MSGRRDTSFPIHDSKQAQRLRNGETYRRVERLFCVKVVLKAPSEAAAGPQPDGETHWVTLKSADSGSESTDKAKNYILSLCEPEVVQECHTDLLSTSNKLCDSLEAEFQTVIIPSLSPGCVRVQGSKEAVQKTISKIDSLMAPFQCDDLPQSQPSSAHNPRPPSPQSIPSPPTTTAFSPSPPPPSTKLPSTSEAEHRAQDRTTPHELPNTPTPNVTMTEKDKILQEIASDIEKDIGVVSRGVDTSHREQKIQYFLSLGFPREVIEKVVDSMGVGTEVDDILKRLNILHVVSSRSTSELNVSRPYTNRGEPVLNSNATLRPVVIDGSNVAMRHGNGRLFSCRGIQIAVNWFAERGHKEITVFVPQWRREPSHAEYPITEQNILNQLERENVLKFTPSRKIGNKRIVCYDDRFIVRLASETNGVIVSNDNFRDLAKENENWRRTIENRLLMFTFVNDIFMVPEDPLGKHGPGLTQLLQMDPPKSMAKRGPMSNQVGPLVCPYGEKCNFGRKCRFLHPEREGRMDPSLFTPRSATGSPSPAERKHNGSMMDVQKDSVTGRTDRLSPSMDRNGPSGQPVHTSPQRPRTSPSFLAEVDTKSYHHTAQPVPSTHGYSQPQTFPPAPPHGYSHIPQDYLPHSGVVQDDVCSQRQPHYLRIPPVSNGTSLSPPTLHPSPRHSTPATPSGGGCVVSYPSHTFPIATLPTGRSRNVTDRIQPSISPIPNGSILPSSDEFQPTAPNAHPIIPPHHHNIDPPFGLVPRGGDGAPMSYPSISPSQYHAGNPHEMYHNLSSANYHPHHPSYHVPANVFPPSAVSYAHSEPPPPQHHRHHSPTKGGHHGEYSTTPANQVPPQTNMYHNHLPASEVHTYSSDGGMYQTDQRQNPLLQHQAPPHSRGRHVATNDPSEYQPHYAPQGPRAVSLYEDMGMRRHIDRIASEKFQSSQSSPELYSDGGCRYQPPPPGPSVSTSINWTLFKQAQVYLPNHEEIIMRMMQQYPSANLERLVELIQSHR